MTVGDRGYAGVIQRCGDGIINYHNCEKVDHLYPNDGNEGPILTTVYMNGIGRFHMAGEPLDWENYMERVGDLSFFEKE